MRDSSLHLPNYLPRFVQLHSALARHAERHVERRRVVGCVDRDVQDARLRKRRMSIYLGVSPDELDWIAPLYNPLLQQLIDLDVPGLPDDTTPVPVLVKLDDFCASRSRVGHPAISVRCD